MKRVAFDEACFYCNEPSYFMTRFCGNGDVYFCSATCMYKFVNEQEARDVENKHVDNEEGGVEKIKAKIIAILSSWSNNSDNSIYYAYIVGKLKQPNEMIIGFTRETACYVTGMCQDVEKLNSALKYLEKINCCIIL